MNFLITLLLIAMRLKLTQISLIALIVFSRVLARTLLAVSILLVLKFFLLITWIYLYWLTRSEKNNQWLVIENSCGYDSISSKLLKRISEFIEESLRLIINQSLYSGIFQICWELLKLSLSSRKETNIYLTTTDLYPYCQWYQKYLKK